MAQTLEHLAEFQAILQDYAIPSDDPVVRDTHLVLLFGATASGSTTIVSEMAKTGNYHELVSNTTRQPRVDNGKLEQNGKEYWFRTEEEMLEDLRQHRMLEAEIIHNQQVSGISLAELERAYRAGKVAINKVELNIKSIVEAKPDTQAIMVLPPSFEESLRRLHGRGELSPEELYRRIETAVRIYQAGWDWNIFVYIVNDTIAHSIEQIEAAVRGDHRPDEHVTYKQLVGTLLDDAKAWLETH